MTSIRLVATDRAATCKGCQLPIVWRVGLIRPLEMRNGSEHVCANYVKTGKRRFFGGRRATVALAQTAPIGEVADGTVLKRGNKAIACKTCGAGNLEWVQVATANGAAWFYAPFGTVDLSGAIHATRPESCRNIVSAAPNVAVETKSFGAQVVEILGADKVNATTEKIKSPTRRRAAKVAAPTVEPLRLPNPTALLITLDNGAIITISNVVKFDVVTS